MPKKLMPRQWELFYEMSRLGHSKTDASRISGVSLDSVRRFEAGDPNSSGNEWIHWRKHWKNTPLPCPTCGQQLPEDDPENER